MLVGVLETGWTKRVALASAYLTVSKTDVVSSVSQKDAWFARGASIVAVGGLHYLG